MWKWMGMLNYTSNLGIRAKFTLEVNNAIIGRR